VEFELLVATKVREEVGIGFMNKLELPAETIVFDNTLGSRCDVGDDVGDGGEFVEGESRCDKGGGGDFLVGESRCDGGDGGGGGGKFVVGELVGGVLAGEGWLSACAVAVLAGGGCLVLGGGG
jgi:hypothetical protein